MKTFFTACLASLLALAGALPGHAEAPLAAVSFSVERGLPFSLTLDGLPLTRLQVQPVRLDTLAPGQHEVALDLAPTTGRGRRAQHVQATVWLEEGLETSFVLTQRPGYGWQLRQVSTAALPGYGYPDQPGTYTQPAPEPSQPTPGYPPVAGPGYPSGGGYPSGAGYPSGGYPSGAGYPAAPAPSYPPVAPPMYPASPPYTAGGAYAPVNSDVAGLVQALKQCSFDDKRLPIFYQAISRAYLRSDELAQLVRTMTFSDSQCQVAEFGYAHLSDPQNFQRVLAALTFSTDASTVLDKLGLRR